MSAFGSSRGGVIRSFMGPREAVDAPTLDLAGVKVGDYIVARLQVTELGVRAVNVGMESGRDNFLGHPFWVSANAIIKHEPRELAIGDDVVAPDSNGHGVIRAIEDGIAFVRFAPTIFYNYPVGQLKRIERP